MTARQQQALREKLPNIQFDELLSRHSTIRVGGPAAAFFVSRALDDLVEAVSLARQESIPLHILGGGSNTLFADSGFDGLVIKNVANQVTIAGQIEALTEEDWQRPVGEIRHEAADPKKYISFLDLDYPERPGDTLVMAQSGVNLTALIVKTLDASLTGLHWFGGIPGVVGGAVYNNIHGGTHFLGERLQQVEVLGSDNSRRILNKDELELGYDTSRFHQSQEIILQAQFLLTQATAPEVERADQTFREWVRRKSQMQPKLGSMGSTFQNIAQETREQIGAPTSAAGWLIDQCGLKGHQIGQAQIAPEHANFIVNLGGATASDIYGLMQLAKQSVKQEFGVDLKEEVFLVGKF